MRIKRKVLLQTLTFAGDTNKTTDALSQDYDFYAVEGIIGSDGNNDLKIQVNGLTTNIYNFTKCIAATWSETVNQTSATIATLATLGTAGSTPVAFWIQRSAPAGASSRNNGMNQSVFGTSKFYSLYIQNGAMDISTIKFFLSSGTITGTLKIYGVKVGGIL